MRVLWNVSMLCIRSNPYWKDQGFAYGVSMRQPRKQEVACFEIRLTGRAAKLFASYCELHETTPGKELSELVACGLSGDFEDLAISRECVRRAVRVSG